MPGDSTDMVDRVAKALFATEWANKGHSWEMDSAHHEYWLGAARAAIVAMREPNETIIRAGEQIMADWCESPGDSGGPFPWIWRTMIDAALGKED